MVNYVQGGDELTLTAPYTVASGAGALIGTFFGIATTAIASGASGEFAMEGVFTLPKAAGVATAGYPAYWDNSAKNITPVPNGTPPVGAFTAAALTGATTCTVKLNSMGRSGLQISVSAEITANGSAQNFAHGLGVVPSAVVVVPTDTSPATAGVFTVTEGTHTSTNAVTTVTSGKKYKVVVYA